MADDPRLLVLLIAHLAAMRAAFERGDLDETARQGMLAGPVVVERALAAPDRITVLAGITAAPAVADRAELLGSLARLAGGPDFRIAIPAARAALAIAAHLAHAPVADDDLAADDLAAWHDAWAALAARRDRWPEVRTAALEIAVDLAPADALGFDLAGALADPDPTFRATAAALVPSPVPAASRGALAEAVAHDPDARVALAAAAALCAELAFDPPAPIRAALGTDGLARIKLLVAADRTSPAARCLEK